MLKFAIVPIAVILVLTIAIFMTSEETPEQASSPTSSPTATTSTTPSVPAVPAVPAPAPAATPAPVEPTPTPVVLSAAEKGYKTFRRKCMGCHSMKKGDKHKAGPNLWGIVNNAKATAEKYRYSTALKTAGGIWDEAQLNTFIKGPRAMIPKTKMTFLGFKKATGRDEVIAYLKTLKD